MDQALGQGLAGPDAAQAHALAAAVHAAFGRSDAAIERFRRAVGAHPAWRPEASESPKLRALFDEALRRGPLPEVGDAPTRVTTAPPSAERTQVTTQVTTSDAPVNRVETTPVYGRWWFWAAVGTVVAGGIAAAVASQSQGAPVPGGNLGSERL